MNHSEIIRSVSRGGLKSLFIFPVGARSNGRMRTPFGGIKMKPIRRLLLFFALISTAPSVWASCTEGDEKCGADGYVLTCEKSIYTGKIRWMPSRVKCASEYKREMREIIERYDEEVERIERRMQLFEHLQEKSAEELEKREEERKERQRAARVCEPGLRRCHAGMVQRCGIFGEKWRDEYESCESHEINQGDHKYD